MENFSLSSYLEASQSNARPATYHEVTSLFNRIIVLRISYLKVTLPSELSDLDDIQTGVIDQGAADRCARQLLTTGRLPEGLEAVPNTLAQPSPTGSEM